MVRLPVPKAPSKSSSTRASGRRPRKATRRYLEALTGIQDPLGSLNDAIVSRELLSELDRRLAGNAPALGTRAVGIVLGWQAARIHADLAVFTGEWKDFRELRPFWAGR